MNLAKLLTVYKGAIMTLQGADYSHGPISAAAARANGLSFICRYVSTTGNTKNLTDAEVTDFSANGVSVVVVFEQAADNSLGGGAQGIADAQKADAQVTALGLTGCPVYFAVDFQATTAQLATIGDYLQGVSSTIGLKRVGVYGSYSVIKYALDNGLAKYGWQTLAWSSGQLDSRCHIYQYKVNDTIAGVSVDLDRTESSDTDYGQAGSSGPDPVPAVSSVDPADGSAAGGDVVEVTGSGFDGVTAVSFGSDLTTDLSVASDTELSVTSPPASVSGAVHVTVTTPAGISAISDADLFTYSDDI